MRDRHFIAEHRAGPLKIEQHRQLMQWACDCAEHVLPYFGEKIDPRLEDALKVAKAWKHGNVTVGEARKAALNAFAAAKKCSCPTAVAVARSVGQAVATAHMADHSLGAAWYALRAARSASGSVEAEAEWQEGQLPPEIKDLVLTARGAKKFWLKILI